jgi:5'-nucleotidase
MLSQATINSGRRETDPGQSLSIIAVDLDEVLADTVAKRLDRYQKDYAVPLSRAEIYGKQIRDAVPSDRSRAVEACLDEPGFSRDIPIMADAQKVLRELADHFHIFIATTAMDHPNSFLDRYFWLQENLPFLTDRNYVFCGSKSILRANYLIDDNPKNLKAFAGKGILFDAHHNVYDREFTRVRNWLEVGEFFANRCD